jgi:hypothetical protein
MSMSRGEAFVLAGQMGIGLDRHDPVGDLYDFCEENEYLIDIDMKSGDWIIRDLKVFYQKHGRVINEFSYKN